LALEGFFSRLRLIHFFSEGSLREKTIATTQKKQPKCLGIKICRLD
jgi:hypothetical protein